MKPISGVAFATLTASVALSGAYFAHLSAAASSAVSATATPRSVVIELFTSEGCSDCPPADAELRKLGMKQAVPGVDIIPLEEHVDYFNSRHWHDPFSEHDLTLRQYDYMRAFRNDQVYTPQMVVQGRSEFVGSNAARAQTEIDLSAHDSGSFVPLTLTVNSLPGRRLKISVRAPAGNGVPIQGSIVYAITQNGLSSNVAGGENSGRTLNHGAVVRRMDRLAAYNSEVGVANASTTITLRPDTNLQDLHVVAFIQRENAGEILSGAQVDLGGLPGDAVATRK